MSVHATGRALDIHIPLDRGRADNGLGDPIANWLIEHAEQIGIQFIIWDQWTWMADRTPGAKGRVYGGAHPHHDHLHIELSPEGAAMQTPWFEGEQLPPTPETCTLGTEGVVDESSGCLELHGPSATWRAESGTGYAGGHLWTHAFENPSPSNWARFNLEVDRFGRYRLETSVVDGPYALHENVRYAVSAADGEHTTTVDQNDAHEGWLLLGEFELSTGSGQHVDVYDHSERPVQGDRRIVVDALRVTFVPPDRTELNPAEPLPDDPVPGSHVHEPDVEANREAPRSTPGFEQPETSRTAGSIGGGCSATHPPRSSTTLGWGVLVLGGLRMRRRRPQPSQGGSRTQFSAR